MIVLRHSTPLKKRAIAGRLGVCSVVALVVLLQVAIRLQATDETCEPLALRFAHCPRSTAEYKSVILAIHGWNGSCAETFGKTRESLFEVFGRDRFFDWDCFQYDSRKTTLDRNKALLRERLLQLKLLGYEQVSIVSHSTGGILALGVLTDLYLGPKADLEKFPRILQIQAWATPINGLTPKISTLGKALSATGFSPQSLPELKTGSGYLRKLKNRMRSVYDYYLSQPDKMKGAMRTTVTFYQGQGDDWVVASIDPHDGQVERWYWPAKSSLMSTLVETQIGHTHIFSKLRPQQLYSSYPQELIKEEALAHLDIIPRYREIFPRDVVVVTKSMESAQVDIVEGLIFYAAEFPKDFFSPAIGFLRTMYDDSFVRSSKVDDRLIDGFLSLVKQRAGDPCDQLEKLRPFFAQFATNVLPDFDATSKGDTKKLGHQSSRSVQKVLETIDALRAAVNACPRESQVAAVVVPGFSSLDAFNSAMLRKEAQFLGSPHSNVQYRALELLNASLTSVSDRVVADAGLITTVGHYYANASDRLPAPAKKQVAALYYAFNGRSPRISDAAVASLTSVVSYRGAATPLWATLADDRLAQQIVTAIANQTRLKSPEQLTFTTGVIARAGATGTNKDLALKAVQAAAREAPTLAPAARKALADRLKNAATDSKYPTVSSAAHAAARSIMAESHG